MSTYRGNVNVDRILGIESPMHYEPEPSWRSMYEHLNEQYRVLIYQIIEITDYTKKPFKDTVQHIKGLEQSLEDMTYEARRV